MTTATFDVPEPQPYAPILQRVGAALIAVGLVDLGVFIYCIVHRQSYSSSLSLGIIAGFFLVRGKLSAVPLIRFLAAFFLSCWACFPLVLLAWQPWDLTLSIVRLCPTEILTSAITDVSIIGFLFWVVRELSSETVQAALAATSVRMRGIRLALIAGIGVSGIGIIALILISNGEIAKHAITIAQREVGTDYRFQARSVKFEQSNGYKFFLVRVYAWNKSEIRSVPIRWWEPSNK